MCSKGEPVDDGFDHHRLRAEDAARDLRLDAPANAPGTGLPTYWARWVGYDNQPGPWSLPCRTTTLKKEAKQKAQSDATSDAKPDSKSSAKTKIAPAADQPLKIAA